MNIQTKQQWQAETYHLNSKVQQEAAFELLQLLKLSGKEKILDIGCGDGKITAAIAATLKEGQIIGSDLSPEMIAFATQKFTSPTTTNLSFVLLDAQNITYINQFDLVFSSFALQWVSNIELTLRKIHLSLKENGRIGFIIPLSISDALEEALAFLLQNPQWKSYFKRFELNFYLRDENTYDQLLKNCGFKKTHLQVVKQKWIFPSRQDFERYTLPWLPHLTPIPKPLREEFFKNLMDKYIELVPIFNDGSLSFIFDRIDIIAQKELACSSKLNNHHPQSA